GRAVDHRHADLLAGHRLPLERLAFCGSAPRHLSDLWPTPPRPCALRWKRRKMADATVLDVCHPAGRRDDLGIPGAGTDGRGVRLGGVGDSALDALPESWLDPET